MVYLLPSARVTAPKARSFNAPIMAAAHRAHASPTKMSRLTGQCARASRIAQILITVRLGTAWCARNGTIPTASRSVFVSKGVAVDIFNVVWHNVTVQVSEIYPIVPDGHGDGVATENRWPIVTDRQSKVDGLVFNDILNINFSFQVYPSTFLRGFSD